MYINWVYPSEAALPSANDARPRATTVAEAVGVHTRDGALRGQPIATLRGTVFGGQILGMSMSAALEHLPPGRWPTSMLAHFVAAPDPGLELTFDVDLAEVDGRSFSWRRVRAEQAGQVVAHSTIAFTRRERETVRHGPLTSDPAGDTGSHPYLEHVTMGLLDALWPHGDPVTRTARGEHARSQDIWLRPRDEGSWSASTVNSTLAFISDVSMLSAPLLATGDLGDGIRSHGVSLDHSVRFYSPLDSIGWLLVRQRSTVIGEHLVESRSEAYTGDGRLAFTASQQGLVRRPPR